MFVPSVLAVASTFPTYFVLVYVVGAVAAVSLGLIAWYNSKRPVGWERSERPSFIPKINTGLEDGPPKFVPPVESGEPAESTGSAADGGEAE